jgi:hypothetical protein
VPLSAAETAAAIDALRKDPNLGRDRTIKSLHWRKSSQKEVVPRQAPNWLLGLFAFLGETSRVLLWIAGSIVVALAAVWIYRVARVRQRAATPAEPAPASHIQALDLRPTSLPADIGAAALALLEQGKPRESLSLLYRGALSRAVHRFSANVRESYTEGEALRAVGKVMDPARTRYFAALVALWQRAVYAADVLPDESIAALCRDFSATLGGTAI